MRGGQWSSWCLSPGTVVAPPVPAWLHSSAPTTSGRWNTSANEWMNKWINNHRLFMVSHLVRVQTAYKDIRVCSFHHTHTRHVVHLQHALFDKEYWLQARRVVDIHHVLLSYKVCCWAAKCIVELQDVLPWPECMLLTSKVCCLPARCVVTDMACCSPARCVV